MNIHIQEVKLFGESAPTYFVDYEGETGWKNYSSHSTYESALKAKAALASRYPKHQSSKDCWCEPEYVGDGVYVHRETH